MQMAGRETLDSSIQVPLKSIENKCKIINGLWQLDLPPTLFQDGILDCEPYFRYYTQQCQLALHDGGRHISARTHQNILNIVHHFTNAPPPNGTEKSREDIKTILLAQLPTPKPKNHDELVDGSIDLAARLFLMMDFGPLKNGFSGREQLDWRSAASLQDFTRDYFKPPAKLLEDKNVKLGKIFTARNLGRISGIEIVWTRNLAEHLQMRDEDKRVSIFHCASFLEMQQHHPAFPDDFIHETLRTLALLFPQSERATKDWFLKLPASLDLDGRLVKCGQLRAENRHIQKFTFWHDRLVILKQVFDEATPSTPSQWWYDRRNGVQWYTFWVAVLVLILTVFFGLVQSIEGALQVYKAFFPTPA